MNDQDFSYGFQNLFLEKDCFGFIWSSNMPEEFDRKSSIWKAIFVSKLYRKTKDIVTTPWITSSTALTAMPAQFQDAFDC